MRRRSDGDGKTLLINAALRLFSTEGVDAVSIRAVNREAGLGPASVHYHFSSKDALIDEVLHLYGDDVVDGIVRRADPLINARGDASAHDLVRVFVDSYRDLLIQRGEDGANWVKLINQYMSVDPDRVSNPAAQDVVAKAVGVVFPHADGHQIAKALNLSLVVFVREMASLSSCIISDDAEARSDAERHLSFLVDFLAGGMEAALLAPSS